MQDSHLVIRPMKPEEYNSLIDVWRSAGLRWYREDGVDSEESIRQQILSGNCTVFLADLDGRPVGAVITSYDGRYGWLWRLAVSDQFKRRGLASRLIQYAEECLKKQGAKTFMAILHKDNEPSKRLFSLLGYSLETDLLLAVKRRARET